MHINRLRQSISFLNQCNAIPIFTLLTLRLNNDRTAGPCDDSPSNFHCRCAVFSDPHSANDVPQPQPANPESQREVNSKELMQGTREIIIRHGTDAYRLSVTRSGKLILRK